MLVWGGDGMVQRCVDALAGSQAAVAIIPAGTANQLAGNLGIPTDLPEAVRIAFHGSRRRLDLGKLNGEHFAVMAGAGFDAEMINDADRGLKDRAGRAAYVLTGLRHVRDEPVPTKIRVDGRKWFDGPATCVLFGNVGTITGGIRAFDDARPDDGYLDVGVVTAQGALQWARTLGRAAAGRSERSPFVEMTQGRTFEVKFAERLTYELDGGERGSSKRLQASVVPAALDFLCARGVIFTGDRARRGPLPPAHPGHGAARKAPRRCGRLLESWRWCSRTMDRKYSPTTAEAGGCPGGGTTTG